MNYDIIWYNQTGAADKKRIILSTYTMTVMANNNFAPNLRANFGSLFTNQSYISYSYFPVTRITSVVARDSKFFQIIMLLRT